MQNSKENPINVHKNLFNGRFGDHQGTGAMIICAEKAYLFASINQKLAKKHPSDSAAEIKRNATVFDPACREIHSFCQNKDTRGKCVDTFTSLIKEANQRTREAEAANTTR